MSFKVVKEFVEQPNSAVLLLHCDRACGYSAQSIVPLEAADDPNVQGAFIQQAVQLGWKVTLQEQVCPKHVQKERGEQSLIIVPQARGTVNLAS